MCTNELLRCWGKEEQPECQDIIINKMEEYFKEIENNTLAIQINNQNTQKIQIKTPILINGDHAGLSIYRGDVNSEKSGMRIAETVIIDLANPNEVQFIHETEEFAAFKFPYMYPWNVTRNMNKGKFRCLLIEVKNHEEIIEKKIKQLEMKFGKLDTLPEKVIAQKNNYARSMYYTVYVMCFLLIKNKT